MLNFTHLIHLDKEVNQYIDDLLSVKSNVVLNNSLSKVGGRHFVLPFDSSSRAFVSHDYSNVRILHHGIDTVRQLIEGVPDLSLIDKFEALIADHEFHMPILIDPALPGQWVLRRMGKSSGYRYSLQNAVFGVQIFFISRFQKYEKHLTDPDAGIDCHEPVYGSHLKIQTQSLFNNHHTDAQFESFYKTVCSYFFMTTGWRYKAVAVHLACDLQGWDPTIDMLDNVLVASNKQRIDNGIEKVDLDVHGVIHGRQFETVTLGNVRFTQFTVYDKLARADKDMGSRTYWETVYQNNRPDFDKTQTVRRVEIRYSHNVILQMSDYLVRSFFEKMPANFTPTESFELQANDEVGLRSYFQLKPYLNALWQHGLGKSFRYLYDYANDKKTLHPIWSILLQEVDWGGDRYVDLKRLYRKPVDTRDVEKKEKKNVQMALANMVSIVTRNMSDILDDLHNLIDPSETGLNSFVADFIDSLKDVANGAFFDTVRCVFSLGIDGSKYWHSRLSDYLKQSILRRVLCSESS